MVVAARYEGFLRGDYCKGPGDYFLWSDVKYQVISFCCIIAIGVKYQVISFCGVIGVKNQVISFCGMM